MHDETTSQVVTLEKPIIRGEQEIASVTVRKPVAGELRGLKLVDVAQLDVAALHTLLPRITQPALTAHDVSQLELSDLMQLGVAVAGFFLTRTESAALPNA